VPPAWERCKRCDADLASAQPRVLVGAGAPPASTAGSTFGAARLGPTAAAPPPPSTASRPAHATYTAFDASTPNDVRGGYERVPTVGESWASVAAPTTRKIPIVGMLVTVLILGSCWFAWKQATARHIPEELKPYVLDGDGVDYSTPSGRFSVRLPFEPEEMSESVVVSGAGFNLAAVMSITDEHVLGVAWFDVPSNLIAGTDVNANLQTLVEGYARTDGGVLQELDFLTVQGYSAVDAEFDQKTASGKLRVVLAGTRVYVLVAGGTEDGALGFERLTDSFVMS
jgi:hypothetical protein